MDGWVTPPKDSPRFLSPIGVIRRATGVRGPLEIVDLRYFDGPESPPSDKGYLLIVQRWYVKLFARRDYAFAGRFLVEARRFGQGLSAVAPYGSSGFASPDWIGFQLSADPTGEALRPLPGAWAGIPYDFVEGGAGLEIPGLPERLPAVSTGPSAQASARTAAPTAPDRSPKCVVSILGAAPGTNRSGCISASMRRTNGSPNRSATTPDHDGFEREQVLHRRERDRERPYRLVDQLASHLVAPLDRRRDDAAR